ncbi:MAG: methionine--tRNA ligase [Myxococcaceae bacterium]|nr:methionine--tRNA ligase [Myxococcaceae bacterium]
MSSTFYLTTPIYYVNAPPHLGHLYTTVVGDCLRRHFTQRGRDVFFLTGTDEHGRNIEKAAQSAGIPTQQHVDQTAAKFQQMLVDFSLESSRFIRTTDPAHKAGAQKLFQTLKDNGHIYKGQYDGLYCVACNQYYTEREAVSQGDEKTCPVHGLALERVKEESYFFRLSAFQQPLLEHYRKHPEFIRPEGRLNEVIAFVSGGLEDLSVSRTSVRWGIPVPGDPSHTLYVWLDALSNYITALGYGNEEYDGFQKYWPANLHLVGKDILRFHTVYWPAFLMGAGLELPRQVYAHGMWISGGRKMSKTLGNVINIHALRKHFSVDAVRYFIFREKSFGDDSDFNYPAFIRRYNGELAAGIGNLSSRTLTLVQSSLGGKVPQAGADADNEKVRAVAREVKEEFLAQMEQLEFNVALQSAWRLISETDQYLQATKPWALAKEPSRIAELEKSLGTAAEVLRHLAVMLYPLMPQSMESLWGQLGLAGSPSRENPERLEWGGAGARAMGGAVAALFQRYNEKEVLATLQAEGEYRPEGVPPAAEAPKAPPEGGAEAGVISIDDFMKVDLRVGIVKTADRVQGADKLLKLEVDLGEEQPRQILAGIAMAYAPQELVGRRVVVVANLAPRKMRGLESRGMLLAATGEDGKPALVVPPENVPPGAKVR